MHKGLRLREERGQHCAEQERFGIEKITCSRRQRGSASSISRQVLQCPALQQRAFLRQRCNAIPFASAWLPSGPKRVPLTTSCFIQSARAPSMAADELCGLRRWRCSSALVVSGREQRLWGWAVGPLCARHPFFARCASRRNSQSRARGKSRVTSMLNKTRMLKQVNVPLDLNLCTM